MLLCCIKLATLLSFASRVVVNLFIFDEGFNSRKAFHDLQFSRNECVSSAIHMVIKVALFFSPLLLLFMILSTDGGCFELFNSVFNR